MGGGQISREKALRNTWMVSKLRLLELLFFAKPLNSIQINKHLGRVYDVCLSDEHALPDSAQIAQVEDVVELCRRREHLVLDLLPEDARRGHEHLDDLTDVLRETTLLQIDRHRVNKKFLE